MTNTLFVILKLVTCCFRSLCVSHMSLCDLLMFRKNDVWHPPVAGKFGWGDIETQIVFGHLKYFIH